MRMRIIILQFQLEKQNKRSNLLTLTISCEKRCCLIRSKTKKQNKLTKMERSEILIPTLVVMLTKVMNNM